MKLYLKGIFFLICLFSSTNHLAADVSDSHAIEYQTKLYFDNHNLEIADNIIYIYLENNLIETKVIRTDQQGLYIFENDIVNCGLGGEKEWKCPYCFHWWPIGQKCANPKCPTNKW